MLWVGVGGFFGSSLRFLISKLNQTWPLLSLPAGTLTVNIAGSLLIGILAGIFAGRPAAGNMQLLLIAGFCGGFTTFSAFTFENLQLIENGQLSTALLYIVLSVILGILAVAAGYFLAK